MTERKLVNLGPKIGLVVLPEKVISKLIKITNKTVNTNEDYGYSLAGQIANQKILDEKGNLDLFKGSFKGSRSCFR